jgi:hypothetical protein
MVLEGYTTYTIIVFDFWLTSEKDFLYAPLGEWEAEVITQ